MKEFKGTKEEKAILHAINVWGVYYDDKHPDIAITNSMGEITLKDYLAGYNQALEDTKHKEMLETLKYFTDFPDEDFEDFSYNDKYTMTVMVHKIAEAKQLIKESTQIN